MDIRCVIFIQKKNGKSLPSALTISSNGKKMPEDLVFSLIKGKHTPVNFKFVLHVKPEHVASILEKGDTAVTPEQIRAFVLTVKYDGSNLTLITATAAHSFLMDKTPDNLWDQAIRRFMDRTGLGI